MPSRQTTDLKSPGKLSYALIAACLAAILSLWSIHKRNEIESENRTVSLAAEYESVESLAAAQAMTIQQALAQLHVQGLTSIVLSEETVGELIADGKATLISSPVSGATGLVLKVSDPMALVRVQEGLRIRFGSMAGSLPAGDGILRLPSVSAQLIRTTSIGLNPEQARVATAAGMKIIGRFSNPGGITDSGVDQTLQWGHDLGMSVYLPQGDEVLGRRKAIDETLAELDRLHVYYASAEFAKIAGDDDMVEKAPGNVIRLHAAQTAELDKLSDIDAVERYTRAARERNMRILLVRPLSFGAETAPISEFGDFLKKIADGLMAKGAIMGFPHPYTDPGIRKLFFVLLGLATAPVVWFAAAAFVESRVLRIAGAALLFLLACGCLVKHGQQLMALLGSMAFPILAFVVLEDLAKKRADKPPTLGFVVGAFWLVSALSLTGGLVVAGMLNGLPYYVKALEFPLIRVSVFAPILLVGLYYFVRLTDWKVAMRSPMTWGASLTGLVVGAALAFMLARTGNDSGVGPSGGEMIFRNLLDRFLYVRPRTKEFLIGNPFLIVGIGMLANALKSDTYTKRPAFAGWTVLILMIGAIGQTSIVNTLCHLHIPVLLSLARDVEGLALGCIIGVVVWIAIQRPVLRTEA